MNTEQELELYTINKCEKLGFKCTKQPCHGDNVGLPDLLIESSREEIYVELKTPKLTGNVRRVQWKKHDELRDQGYIVKIIDTKEDIDLLLEHMIRNENYYRNRDIPKRHEENDIIVNWIHENLNEIKSASNVTNSYCLKDIAERELGFYISNSEMKYAMRDAGFRAYDIEDKNWEYHISSRSPLYKKIYSYGY